MKDIEYEIDFDKIKSLDDIKTIIEILEIRVNKFVADKAPELFKKVEE